MLRLKVLNLRFYFKSGNLELFYVLVSLPGDGHVASRQRFEFSRHLRESTAATAAQTDQVVYTGALYSILKSDFTSLVHQQNDVCNGHQQQ